MMIYIKFHVIAFSSSALPSISIILDQSSDGDTLAELFITVNYPAPAD